MNITKINTPKLFSSSSSTCDSELRQWFTKNAPLNAEPEQLEELGKVNKICITTNIKKFPFAIKQNDDIKTFEFDEIFSSFFKDFDFHCDPFPIQSKEGFLEMFKDRFMNDISSVKASSKMPAEAIACCACRCDRKVRYFHIKSKLETETNFIIFKKNIVIVTFTYYEFIVPSFDNDKN